MKKPTIDTAVNFNKIRKIIANEKQDILELVADLAKRRAADKKIYNEQTVADRTRVDAEKAEKRIAELRETASKALKAEFALVNEKVNDWFSAAPDSELLGVLKAFSDFGITPTKTELDIISERSSGSYIAQRIVQNQLEKYGFFDETFVDAETMARMIREAEHDCVFAAENFCGNIENNRLLADAVGLTIGQDSYGVDFASRFPYDGCSLNDLENAFEHESSKVSLLPSTRERLDALFAGKNDDERKQAAIDLILNDEDSTEISSKLRLYDQKLYDKANDEIRKNELIAEKAAREAFRDAVDKLSEFRADRTQL